MEQGAPNKQGKGGGKTLIQPEALHEPMARSYDASLGSPDEKHNTTHPIRAAYMYAPALSKNTQAHAPALKKRHKHVIMF